MAKVREGKELPVEFDRTTVKEGTHNIPDNGEPEDPVYCVEVLSQPWLVCTWYRNRTQTQT